jgi:hypothetical protein
MGSFVLYILEWALCLLFFLVVYKVCFSGSTFHRFNRYYLLGSVAITALLPMIHISIGEHQEADVKQLRIADTQFAHELSATSFIHTSYDESLSLDKNAKASRNTSPATSQYQQIKSLPSLWPIVLIFTYITYVVFLICGWAKSFYKMCRFIKGKPRHKLGRWIYIVIHDEQFGPFSWLNYIVISNQEDGFARKASILHEFSHVKNGHAIDLVYILAGTVLNPVCWLVLREIKIIHEYEADDEVINRHHIQKRDYQRLLIMRTVGAEAYALASSFNLNIKQRIKMMKKKQSTWWRMSCILVTIPIVGTALTAFAEPRRVLIEKIDSEVNNMTELVSNDISSRSMSQSGKDKELLEADKASAKQTTKVDTKLKAGDIVTGTVYGLNNPLSGANITETDANQRIVNLVTTDEKGHFSLKVNNPANELRISFVGFNSFKGNFSQKNIHINMTSSTAAMKEVSVYSYSKEKPAPAVTSQKISSDSPNVTGVEQMPSYPGGYDAWMNYLTSHIHYPVAALRNNVQANIQVVFIVDIDGNIRSPRIIQTSELKPLDEKVKLAAKNGDVSAMDQVDAYNDGLESLKEEAISILRHSSQWIPGRQNGNPVNCQYSLPINFMLK